jgi:MerR family redox-sensitive transcriptional activator SoxR
MEERGTVPAACTAMGITEAACPFAILRRWPGNPARSLPGIFFMDAIVKPQLNFRSSTNLKSPSIEWFSMKKSITIAIESAAPSARDIALAQAGISLMLSVGELAQRSGVAVSTLHFYERRGMIRSARTSGNQRRYARDVLRRVALIRVAQRVGIALADIDKALNTLPPDATPSRADWQRLSAEWRTDLDERIAQLKRLRDTLDDCIGCGCLSIENCRLRNPKDRLAQSGAGPRRLLTGQAGRE